MLKLTTNYDREKATLFTCHFTVIPPSHTAAARILSPQKKSQSDRCSYFDYYRWWLLSLLLLFFLLPEFRCVCVCAQVYLLLFLFCYRCMLNAWCFCGIMALIAHTNEAAFGAKLCSVWSPIDKHTNIFYAVSNTWHRIWNGLKMKLKKKRPAQTTFAHMTTTL